MQKSPEPVKCRFLPVDSDACGIKQACKHWAFACPLSAVSLADFFTEGFTFAVRDYILVFGPPEKGSSLPAAREQMDFPVPDDELKFKLVLRYP